MGIPEVTAIPCMDARFRAEQASQSRPSTAPRRAQLRPSPRNANLQPGWRIEVPFAPSASSDSPSNPRRMRAQVIETVHTIGFSVRRRSTDSAICSLVVMPSLWACATIVITFAGLP